MYEFQIDKMSCMGCVRHIQSELKVKDPLVVIKADLKTVSLSVISSLTKEELIDALAEVGYKAEERCD